MSLDGEPAEFFGELKHLRDRFFDAMDDDFNTGAAVGFLFEMRRCLNHFVSQRKLESVKDGDKPALAAMTQKIKCALIGPGNIGTDLLANLLGVFRKPLESAGGADDGLVHNLMQLIIEVRALARKSKNFDIADRIRDGLGDLQVVLEDRPEGTNWRRG